MIMVSTGRPTDNSARHDWWRRQIQQQQINSRVSRRDNRAERTAHRIRGAGIPGCR